MPFPTQPSIDPRILAALLSQLGNGQQQPPAPLGGPQLPTAQPRQGGMPPSMGPMIPPSPTPAVTGANPGGTAGQMAQMTAAMKGLRQSGLFGTPYQSGSAMSRFGGDQNYSYGDMAGNGMGGSGGLMSWLGGLFGSGAGG